MKKVVANMFKKIIAYLKKKKRQREIDRINKQKYEELKKFKEENKEFVKFILGKKYIPNLDPWIWQVQYNEALFYAETGKTFFEAECEAMGIEI